MAQFIPPYSKAFTQRLEAVKAIREQKEEQNQFLHLSRHRGSSLNFSSDVRKSNKDVDISNIHLPPGTNPTNAKKVSLESSSLLRALSAAITAEPTPVWTRLHSNSKNASKTQQHSPHSPPTKNLDIHGSRGKKVWLPTGATRIQAKKSSCDIGTVRSPHKRLNDAGRVRLATDRKFRRAERRLSCTLSLSRQKPSCSRSASPSRRSINYPQSPPRSASACTRPPFHSYLDPSQSPHTPHTYHATGTGNATVRSVIVTAMIVDLAAQTQTHAMLSVSSACSRQELLYCMCTQLHLQLPSHGLSLSASPPRITHLDSLAFHHKHPIPPDLIHAPSSVLDQRPVIWNITLLAESSYGKQTHSCSLIDGTLMDPPLSGPFVDCDRVLIAVHDFATNPTTATSDVSPHTQPAVSTNPFEQFEHLASSPRTPEWWKDLASDGHAAGPAGGSGEGFE